MLRNKLDRAAWRAAWWTGRALFAARRTLRSGTVDGKRLPAPPCLPAHTVCGVAAVLRRLPHTCLERSLVLQCWHAAQGRPRDVVVGVTAPSRGFSAHAWLDGSDEGDGEFLELLRFPAA